jgi:serine/threonine-protein kinase
VHDLDGFPPFADATLAETREQAAAGDLSSPLSRLGTCGADAELISLAKWCLSTDSEARPRHAGIVANEMARHLASVQERLRAAELARAEANARATHERKVRRLTAGLTVTSCALAGLGIAAWLWFAHDRAARVTRTVTQVIQELQEGALRRGQAKAGPTLDQEQWHKALQAARRAEALIANEETDADTPRRNRTLLQDLEQDERANYQAELEAAKDRRMVDNLTELRLQKIQVTASQPQGFSLHNASLLSERSRKQVVATTVSSSITASGRPPIPPPAGCRPSLPPTR